MRLLQIEKLGLIANLIAFGVVWPSTQAIAQVAATTAALPWFDANVLRVVLAGGLGGLVRWMALKEHWKSGLVSICIGAISAAYLGPIALPIVSPVLGNIVGDPLSIANLSAFLIGLFGTGLTGYLIDILHRRKAELPPKGDGK